MLASFLKATLWLLPNWFGNAFGVRQPRSRIFLGLFLAPIIALILFIIMRHFSTHGCSPFSSDCSVFEVKGETALELILALATLIWSIGISFSQKEQSNVLEGMSSAQQRFHNDFSSQLRLVNQHFGEIPAHDDMLTFHMYLSSPALGILSGGEGIRYYREILERFAQSAKVRLDNKKRSELHLYFWEPQKHSAIFGKSATQKKDYWDNSTQLKDIEQEIEKICKVFSDLHSFNDLSDRNGSIDIYLYDIIDPNECRFFLLNTGQTKLPAVIMMVPIDSTTQTSEQASILLTDNTRHGYDIIDDFFRKFTAHIVGRYTSEPEQLKAGNLLCSDPKGFFKKYFDHDF